MKNKIFIIILSLCFWSSISYAGVTVGGTRVIYNGAKKETTLSVRNPDKRAFLIQAWMDSDGADGAEKGSPKPPFIVTPPIFRLDAGAENIMRIIRSGGNLPEDRESVFWMNVKSIPSMSEDAKNVLQIAVKTRIKMFYRPASLKAPTNETWSELSFHRNGNNLEVNNPTPYYVSFSMIKVGSSPIDNMFLMVAPKKTESFKMASENTDNKITWKVINDFGGETPEQHSLLK